mmetsp:Transcript_72628/g.187338  ORF Transcript_72628/g.187338 Transcript_72628/m.187338 type:complete len:499 (+) Transcript_72628:113-1609(+)|eukprot:CAMPEP_0195084944 /NCGR_PEP_ID=MMETSP0448-20130528/25494_1 /TAXON_ID=66468 /ORGANISM="Heterocapsa triquestra, Strain CCMP 448" /LENGTH=498 /DNA_ID=CAMNT_0040118311 /DNA_START=9 /DNA_END=1505 /DNA_ORIENTATION=+
MDLIFDILTGGGDEGAPARQLQVMGALDTDSVPNPADLTWVLVIAALCMLYMAWGIGANDVANSFATAFGANCLTIHQACVIAAVCELGGSVLLGGSVSDTIRKGMMDIKLYAGDEGRVIIMAGMTSVLLAAATWLLVASKYGLPVSTTHSAVGGVVAIAVASKGYDSVKWDKVGMIVLSWFVSPALASFVGFCSYAVIKKMVMQHEDSFRRAKIASPILVFILMFTVAMFTIYKGAKGIGLDKISTGAAIGISVAVSLVFAGISYPLMMWHAKNLEAKEAEKEAQKATEEAGTAAEKEKDPSHAEDVQVQVAEEANVEKVEEGIKFDQKTEMMFKSLVVVIAGFQSLAHGANDVANSVGPFGAVLAAKDGPLSKKTEIPIWVFFLAGGFIVIGLIMYGQQVMRTIGKNITEVTPSKACCAQWAATLVVLLATRLGLPISTTHAAVGGVLGVGLVDGTSAINWRVMVKIFFSWIITLPICGLAAAGTYALFLPAVLLG